MFVSDIYVLPVSGSQAMNALIARCAHTAQFGNHAESRAYLSGIFEVLAEETAGAQGNADVGLNRGANFEAI